MTIRKKHINIHVDLQGTLGTKTTRTSRKNVGQCFLFHARKHLDGMSKHFIRKFAIKIMIRALLSEILICLFFVKMGLHAQNRTCNINHSWKSINVIANHFTKLILCYNQQWDRTEIRNNRNVLSLFSCLLSKMILYSDQLTVVIFKCIKAKRERETERDQVYRPFGGQRTSGSI